MKIQGGFTNYGEPVGILMLETRFARPVGDIGNARTFDFPVKFFTVRGATPDRVVTKGDRALLGRFTDGARFLEAEGVKAITTSCGFLALFQEEIAASMRVPFFSSSLLQVPLVYRITGKKGKVGVLTVSKASLTNEHFRCVGAGEVPVAIHGMDRSKEFRRIFMNSTGEGRPEDYALDFELCASEMRDAALDLVAENPDVRAVVMECTNMPPFREEVQHAIGLPVFDIVTLTRYIYHSLPS